MAQQFIVREFQEHDRAYITRTVLFSMLENDKQTRRINKDSFLNAHNKIINAILNHSKCLVIADPEEPKLIYGFIIYDQEQGNYDVIHFAYIRKDFRELGLLKNLKEVIKTRDNLAITHITDSITPARMKKHYSKVIYDPMLIIQERS